MYTNDLTTTPLGGCERSWSACSSARSSAAVAVGKSSSQHSISLVGWRCAGKSYNGTPHHERAKTKTTQQRYWSCRTHLYMTRKGFWDVLSLPLCLRVRLSHPHPRTEATHHPHPGGPPSARLLHGYPLLPLMNRGDSNHENNLDLKTHVVDYIADRSRSFHILLFLLPPRFPQKGLEAPRQSARSPPIPEEAAGEVVAFPHPLAHRMKQAGPYLKALVVY